MIIFSITISSLALLISGITFWLTYLRRGTVKMTQPTTIYLGNDKADVKLPKVYLRTLLYSTSKKGQIIESFYIKLKRGETSQNFNIWVYGNDKLYRGSGLFVGQEGVTFYHHFLLPKDGTDYHFLPGDYNLEVYCKLVDSKKQKKLLSISLNLTDNESRELQDISKGLYFDWGPDSNNYNKLIRVMVNQDLTEDLLNIFEK
jgi:hypothetical protein